MVILSVVIDPVGHVHMTVETHIPVRFKPLPTHATPLVDLVLVMHLKLPDFLVDITSLEIQLRVNVKVRVLLSNILYFVTDLD